MPKLIRSILIWLGLVLIHTTLLGAATKPNVLLIVADDWGLQAGCYGEKAVHTPHVDQLARGSMKFTRAYVTQASCSPSRSSMLTGLYPHQNGQAGLAPFNSVTNKPPARELWFQMNQPTPPNLPATLKSSGYRTGVIGKIHVDPESAFQFDFARIYGQDILNTRRTVALREMTDEFLDTTSSSPFFLMMNFCDPHHPHTRDVEGSPRKKVSATEVQPFPFDRPDKATPLEEIADYYTCVNRMDEMLGIVLDTLAKKKRRENTLIILVGDNGPPFAGAKTTCFEAGLRVPLIIDWPGKNAGTCDGLVSTIDLVPTILEAAGIQPPEGLPGLSLSPWWAGKKPDWRRYLSAEYTAHEPHMVAPQRTIRDDRFKLIVHLFDDPALVDGMLLGGKTPKQAFAFAQTIPAVSLYDLKRDPWEKTNLADRPEHQMKLQELLHELQRWREKTRDPLLDKQTFQSFTKTRYAKHLDYLKVMERRAAAQKNRPQGQP